ncbi:MAG: PTS sugar transporter subunit IIB [Erysipelotrichaceae bacterium]|nr:PTS sugar transporter subunit IIB [Erysipelotrichaceae bacterium]
MIKILVCCASGSGTSMMMKLTAEKACKALGIEASVAHAPIAEAKSVARQYDIVITSPAFVSTFDSVKNNVKIAAVKSPLSQAEYTKALKDNGLA